MARPRKQGLDFFPMDVNLFSAKEIHMIQDQYGADGISFYLYLLCNIFKNGYYLQIDTAFFRNVFFDLEMDQEQAISILGFFLEESLFDMGLFQSDKVLTSRPIQRQFQKAVKERAKKNTILIECFWLLDERETEPFLKISRTISRNYLDCSGENPELFPEKPAIIPEKTSDYSGKNFSFSIKKAGYSKKNPSFSDKKQGYSREETLKNNKIYNISKRAITREEKQELIQEFGAEITEEYIRRTSEYHCCNPETIRKWIKEDQKKHKRNENAFTSFPQRNYEQNVMNSLERHLLRDDRKDAKEEIIQLPISSSLM